MLWWWLYDPHLMLCVVVLHAVTCSPFIFILLLQTQQQQQQSFIVLAGTNTTFSCTHIISSFHLPPLHVPSSCSFFACLLCVCVYGRTSTHTSSATRGPLRTTQGGHQFPAPHTSRCPYTQPSSFLSPSCSCCGVVLIGCIIICFFFFFHNT